MMFSNSGNFQPETTAKVDHESESILLSEHLDENQQELASLALARRLVAEEAIASFHYSMNFVREAHVQPLLEDLEVVLEAEDEDSGLNQERNMSYDEMLRISEQIGDVKAERWKIKAQSVIQHLPSFRFGKSKSSETCDCTCTVCQCLYEESDLVRQLPCGHIFHAMCVDRWLGQKDTCPYCRKSICN